MLVIATVHVDFQSRIVMATGTCRKKFLNTLRFVPHNPKSYCTIPKAMTYMPFRLALTQLLGFPSPRACCCLQDEALS